MPEIIELLEEEKEVVQEQLIDYSKKGNSYAIGVTNEKLKYINYLIKKAYAKYDIEEDSEQVEWNKSNLSVSDEESIEE